jgi:hypothetical protein
VDLYLPSVLTIFRQRTLCLRCPSMELAFAREAEITLLLFFMPTQAVNPASYPAHRSSPAARIAYEERVLAVQHDALHFPFADIVVDRNCAIGTEETTFSACFGCIRGEAT